MTSIRSIFGVACAALCLLAWSPLAVAQTGQQSPPTTTTVTETVYTLTVPTFAVATGQTLANTVWYPSTFVAADSQHMAQITWDGYYSLSQAQTAAQTLMSPYAPSPNAAPSPIGHVRVWIPPVAFVPAYSGLLSGTGLLSAILGTVGTYMPPAGSGLGTFTGAASGPFAGATLSTMTINLTVPNVPVKVTVVNH